MRCENKYLSQAASSVVLIEQNFVKNPHKAILKQINSHRKIICFILSQKTKGKKNAEASECVLL